MTRIGCAGILVKDTFCGLLQAVPRPGELVAVEAIKSKAGGCAANVAIDLRKQHLSVDLVGCLGRDAAGELLVKELQAAQVNCDQLFFTTEYPTSETVILLVKGEDRRYLHTFGANRAFAVEHINLNWLAELDVFYLGGLFAMPGLRADSLLPLLAFCREQKVITVVDVVLPTDFKGTGEMERLLPHIDWFLPNDSEAAVLTGQTDPFEALRICRDWGAQGLVITRGQAGSLSLFQDECWHCDAYPWLTVDPSGAGDAFTSGLIAGIANGWEFARILMYASAIGASATGAIGTTDGVLTDEEADQLVKNQPLTVTHRPLSQMATIRSAPKRQ
jgi:sugar/nucleoside kinase (ribokinase family)